MNRSTEARAPLLSIVVRAAAVIAAAALFTGCATIPQRAWRNGEAMTASRAYQAVLNGDRSFNTHRALETSLNPLRLNYREVPFPPFGHWDY